MNPAAYIPGEIYARQLVLDQPNIVVIPNNSADELRHPLMSEAAFAFHALSWAFNMSHAPQVRAEPDIDSRPPWLGAVCRALRIKNTSQNFAVSHRNLPEWWYFNCWSRGVTVVEIPEEAADRLRDILDLFKPIVAYGVNRIAMRTSHILNAIPLETRRLVRELVRAIDARDPSPDEPLLVPMESHLFALGQRSIVVVREQCGRDAYEDERLLVEARRSEQAAVFMTDAHCVWAEHPDDGRFQSLIRDLLEAEAGIQRIREVGSVHDRDGGRDILAEWRLPPDRGGNATYGSEGQRLLETREVLVQVKVRERSINKADVTDIRDTLEHHGCSGFLLVAFPRITVPLFDHLAKLRNRGELWIDWWELPQIESRLRRNPDVAVRYPDLVKLAR